jgi:hypothetical protein
MQKQKQIYLESIRLGSVTVSDLINIIRRMQIYAFCVLKP